MLDDLISRIAGLDPRAQKQIADAAAKACAGMKWLPNVGPQTAAYFHRADILLYGGQGGGGKALALDTRLPTPDGWTTMGAVAVGDIVFDKDGHPTRVIATSPVMLGRACFVVRFSDGSEVVADADHKWLTFTLAERERLLSASPEWRAKRRAKRPSRAGGGVRLRPDLAAKNRARVYDPVIPTGAVRTTAEIADTLIARPGRRPHANHSVKVCSPLALSEKQVAIDPYLLGAWLGDGVSKAARITIAEQEMVDHVTAAVAGSGWSVRKGATKYDYGIPGGLKVALSGYGLVGNKHIPQVYLRGSFDQRLALLQGLMDTDGFVKPSGGCEFTTTSPALRDGMLELLSSLGIQAYMTEGRAMLRGRDCGPKYRIKFTSALPAFRLGRKLERQQNAKLRQTTRHRYIVAVEPTKSVPVKCIAVESATHTYLCGERMIPTHNTDLELGLAFTAHQRSLIMRRQYVNLSAIIDRAIDINGSRDGFNGKPPPRLKTADGRIIDFGAASSAGDEQGFQGQPHDLLCLDEATQFLESQVRFLLGWLRTTVEGQRVRAVLGTNPPLDASGDWIIGMFRPWLDVTYHKPAKAGELRWFVTAPDGKDLEVDGPSPVDLPGVSRALIPMSRSFLPAALKDNPYLVKTDYQAKLDGLPEPLRSAVRDGNFMAARGDAEWQVIPTQWIIEAQARWTADGHRGKRMTAAGLDIGAGRDETVFAPRYGAWYAPLETMTGDAARDPAHAAQMVVRRRTDNCPIVVDVGGGFGGPSMMLFKGNGIECRAFNGAGASTRKTRDGKLGFYNKRAEAWWQFREELDPGQVGGSAIALPPDPQLRADLAAPTWEMTTRGIKIESKEDIKERIGRSPDRGDAVVMALSEGNAAVAAQMTSMRPTLKVVMGKDRRR